MLGYLDPATGSMLFGAIAAAAASIVVGFRHMKDRIFGVFSRGGLSSSAVTSPDSETFDSMSGVNDASVADAGLTSAIDHQDLGASSASGER